MAGIFYASKIQYWQSHAFASSAFALTPITPKVPNNTISGMDLEGCFMQTVEVFMMAGFLLFDFDVEFLSKKIKNHIFLKVS